MNKILEGAKQAAAFARCDCDHAFVYTATPGTIGQTKFCLKCNVRITEYPRKDLSDIADREQI